MPKVLVTAEAFGFGPASKLHAICVELGRRGIECHFVGQMSALTFAQSNAEAFRSIMAADSMSHLAAIAPGGYDAAISVMDPHLTLWSRLHNVPCVYVDSLYWFWQWSPDDEADLQKLAADLLRSADGVAGTLRSLGNVPMHDSQYLAYYLSTVACAQRAPGAAARVSTMAGIEPVSLVDAVVDLSHRAPARPTRWLATASGMLNPLYSMELALEWVTIVARLLDEAAATSQLDVPIDLAGNPDVLARAAGSVPDRIQLIPLDHQGILRAMNHAIACLTPPGLTTVLESAAYGTPVIFLPEQHYAHLSNFRALSRCGGSDTFPHTLLNADAAGPGDNNQLAETAAIADELRKCYAERGDAWHCMVSGIADGMTRAHQDRTALQMAQDEAVRGFVGGYAGASQIAAAVETLIGDG